MAVHRKHLLLLTVFVVLYTKSETQPMSLPNCQTMCGNVTIPFPFGTTKECSLDNTFLIDCNKTSSTSTDDVPFLPQTNQRVLNISLHGELRVAWPVSSDCYLENGTQVNQTLQNINMAHFHISPTQNKFIAVGCDTVGILTAADSGGKMYFAGCVAFCNNRSDIDIVANLPCSGIGCCEIPIPQANMLTEVAYVSGGIYKNHTLVHDFNPCGYAFLVENGTYSLTQSDLELKTKEFPVLLNWTVGNQTCLQAQESLSNYACKAEKSKCYETGTNKSGYLCRCFDGYGGNPYLKHGCQGIIFFFFSFVMIHVHREFN